MPILHALCAILSCSRQYVQRLQQAQSSLLCWELYAFMHPCAASCMVPLGGLRPLWHGRRQAAAEPDEAGSRGQEYTFQRHAAEVGVLSARHTQRNADDINRRLTFLSGAPARPRCARKQSMSTRCRLSAVLMMVSAACTSAEHAHHAAGLAHPHLPGAARAAGHQGLSRAWLAAGSCSHGQLAALRKLEWPQPLAGTMADGEHMLDTQRLP